MNNSLLIFRGNDGRIALTMHEAGFAAESEHVTLATATCSGSRQWPSLNARNEYYCRDCGEIFARNDLQGRDDHMPPHFVSVQS